MTTRNASLTTRNARKSLKPQPKPHFRALGEGLALGYRRKEHGGVWLVNLYLGDRKYREAMIGVADDNQEADGVRVLSFDQAKKVATQKAEEWRAAEAAKTSGGLVTVATAVKAYVAMMNAREDAQGRPRRAAELGLGKHVLADPLAAVPLHALTESALSDWRARRSEGRAESTVRRISNDLRAALNAAAKRYRATLPADLPIIIKNGLASESHDQPIARDDAALPDDDVRKLLDAAAEIDEEGDWDGDLHRMVVTLAATGARFSQVIRIRVGDLQVERGRLMVPVSRKGKGAKGSSHIPVRIGEDVIDVLLPATKGRKNTELLLTRWAKELGAGGFANWKRTGRTAWKEASEIKRPWALIVKKAGLPAGTVPYALRHSSIVRALGAGLPVRLVAAMHDTSTQMIEKHYSGSIASMLDDMAGSVLVPLVGKKEPAKIIPIRG